MSNYALQSQVSQLESELSKVRAENGVLRRQIVAATNGIYNANQELKNCNSYIQSNLENCNETIVSSNDKVISAYELQAEIEKLYLRFKNVELANKKIRACNNKCYYDFNNYRIIRKIVQGMMDNLEINMVTDETITKAVETQHLQVPDYWLTCVLISIMAWNNDDRELAEKAIDRAISLDKKNSSIFFMIFNIRMSRDEASLKWFSTYQQCELKGSDEKTFLMLFSLVSKTIKDNADDETCTEIYNFIKKVISTNISDSGYSEERILETIMDYFTNMKPNNTKEYSLLKEHCLEYSYLENLMLCAKNNSNILDFLIKTINVPVEEKNKYLKNYIDELISTPNQVEKSTYEEIAYNELIIENQGNVEVAKKQHNENIQKNDDNLNLVAEMIEWIYGEEYKDINGHLKLSAFTLTKDLQEKAIKGYVEHYRNLNKSKVNVRINDYNSQVDFMDEPKEKQKISDYYIKMKEEELIKIKNLKAYIAIVISVGTAAGAYFINYWLLSLSVICLLYGVFKLLRNKLSRKKIKLNCEESIKNVSEICCKLFCEYEEYIKEYAEYDGLYSRITNEFSKV